MDYKIRAVQKGDLEQILDIWLEASVISHDFIDSNYWVSKIRDMKDIYIPNSETYVYEDETGICGFLSLCENTLAAIFVKPDKQSKGIGGKLLQKAKELRNEINLTVYKENSKSVLFYRKAGFYSVREQKDKNTEN